MAFDSVTNRNEYFSAHYLASLLQAGLKDQRDRWTELEGKGEPTARTRLRSLGGPFFAARADADDDIEALRHLHDAVIGALGFAPERSERTFVRGAESLDVPVASACETSTGLLLVAIEAGFATDVDAVLAKDGAGRLLDPPISGATATGAPKPAMRSAVELVAHLFACDDPPRYVLVLAGGIVVLADRQKWGEGKYLAANLDDALGRNDTSAKGELETIAGLFSADVLVPDDGQSTLDELVAASRKQAVGVSEDLRDGIRLSIELLANEVIVQRLAAHQGVYNGEVDPKVLTQQCLRYLYRLVFLLFAEARPELGILPVDHPEYAEGYGLDRLREVALTELHSERARNGTHIQESLGLLFELVNDGYRHAGAQASMTFDEAETHIGLVFEPLKSELFSERATPLLDRVKLRNEVLQQVLALLMLSKEKRNAAREFVSYANLGINQLGAVYEGLMAYSGFFATEDLYEVAKHGDPHKGSWVVPVTDADDYPDDVFVTRTTDNGGTERVRHAKGDFVFRLSGRDRQRSASYYTPKVLTECVVKHALAELLDQDDTTTPAKDILDLTICEPALGSGAFLNEAIDQLAAQYLTRRQDEVGESLDPETYTVELQKVKAHLALHQCYGVDLNATATELAEVSLWLNAMHPGLQAPWFGLHLRRGNSLIGARRATYAPEKLKKGAWLKAAPTDRKLAEGPTADGEIHHFLLPADGWGAVTGAKEAKELRPDEVARLKDWKKTHKNLDARQIARLQALARRVESLWELATRRLAIAEKDLRRPIELWKGPEPSRAAGATREELEAALLDPDSALGRLRLVMDAWCSLWFWPVDGPNGAPKPPGVGEWLDTLEAILGTDPGDVPEGQLDLFADLDTLLAREEQLALDFSMQLTENVRAEQPWLGQVAEIRDREAFFHWELEFAPVFERGGFDLQVGNPPWVRPTWQDGIALAEFDPWFGVTESTNESVHQERRQSVLADAKRIEMYLDEVTSIVAVQVSVGSPILHPILTGIQPNLFMVFMDQTWRTMNHRGSTGLLHPESHFADSNGGPLRRATYRRLRRHWQFEHIRLFFREVEDRHAFGINIYGDDRSPSFLQIGALTVSADVIEDSLVHNGEGAKPGIQYESGGWDVRPHAARVISVDQEVLASWARLYDEPGTAPTEARLLRPVTRDDLDALLKLSEFPVRVSNTSYHWASGLHEKNARRAGIIEKVTRRVSSWDDVILQGPHFTVSNPFAKEPDESGGGKDDYSPWDLESLPNDAIPRTNYQRSVERDKFDSSTDQWNGRSSSKYWRITWRAMTQPSSMRSLQAALLLPGPSHVNSAFSLALETPRSTATMVGLWSSIVYDYILKVAGVSNVKEWAVRRLPYPVTSETTSPILLRTLRLNCLIGEYAPLWYELFDPTWLNDDWTDPSPTQRPLNDVEPTWSMATPLRTDFDRRKALIELDALAALMLGLSADQLCAMYRTQFAVLRKYEFNMVFDAHGRKIAKDHQTAGVRQEKGDWELVQQWLKSPGSVDLRIYEPPFYKPDREKEMRVAYEEFARRHGTDSD